MKGVFLSAARTDAALALLARVDALSTPDVRLSFFFELYPTATLMAVPPGATAFVRGSYVNVMVFVIFDGHGAERLEEVRRKAAELLDVALEGEGTLAAADNTGYGNYGAWRTGMGRVVLLTNPRF